MSNPRPAGLSDEDDSDYDGSEYFAGFDKVDQRKPTLFKAVETDESLFYSALKNGDVQTMNAMLLNGFHVDQPLSGGWSPLMHACLLGSLPIVKFLVKQGANVNFNKELCTPLMALCQSRSPNEDELSKCFDVLMLEKVNINAADRYASTALMNACSYGHIELVKKLLAQNCDVNVQDTLGKSALFHAVNEGFEEIVQVLVKDGKARLDLIDKQRRTAFDLAILKGHDDLSKLICCKKDKRRLVEEEENTSLPCKISRDPVEDLLAQLPCSNNKSLSGFSSDVGKLLSAMGLRHFVKLFETKNVQLNEFLIIKDERLKELGARFSIHRLQVLNSIKKFHIHQWNKTSLGMKPRNQKVQLRDGIKLMCNVTKHLHVLNSTLIYVGLHQSIPVQSNVFKACEDVVHQLDLISRELNLIQSFASLLKIKEKHEPVDLIKPKKVNLKYVSLALTTAFVGFLVLCKINTSSLKLTFSQV